MNALARVLAVAIVGLVVLRAASPTLVTLAHALVPLVLVSGVVAALLWTLRYLTRR